MSATQGLAENTKLLMAEEHTLAELLPGSALLPTFHGWLARAVNRT